MSEQTQDPLTTQERAALTRVLAKAGFCNVSDALIVAEVLNRVAPAPAPRYKLKQLLDKWLDAGYGANPALSVPDMGRDLANTVHDIETALLDLGPSGRDNIRRILGLPQ